MKKIFILYFIFALFMPVSCVADELEVPVLETNEIFIQTNYSASEAVSEAPEDSDSDAVSEAQGEAVSEVQGEVSSEVGSQASNAPANRTDIEAYGSNLTVYLNEPGTLYKMCRKYFDNVDTDKEYGEEIWGNITSITLSGIIDARDFSTLKWNFRNLQNVDLGGAKIVSYRGKYGTNEGYYDGGVFSTYNANEIPIGAFFYWQSNDIREFPSELYDEGMTSLRSVKLPDGVKVIRRNAFARAYNMKEINIPEGVESVEMVAFRYCMSIEKLYLPSTLKNVGWLAFTEMSSLKEVHIAAKNMPIEETGHSSLQTFGNRLDASQVGGEIGQIWRGWVIQMEGQQSSNEKTDAVLYVPVGCKANYKDWEKYFVKIVEE